ncbi:hypothetical protein [Chryseobacterium sp. MYb328]|uniref:hypothetical protein n=1 Tax=Chryseobacterium sp. MYb328 TaxID=2745231 RepID=UPI0030A72ED6
MKIVLFLFFLASEFIYSQAVISDEYHKIPDSLHFKDDLYKSIIPDKKYENWKVMRKYDSLREELLYENKSWLDEKNIRTHSPDQGFFVECMPDWCFTYIRILDNKKFRYIDSEEELRSFIGYVDNIQEALLIAKTYGFWFDQKDPVGGSFKQDEDYFYLYLAKFENCPVSRESFFIKLNRKTRAFESQTKGVYYKTDKCFVS